MVWVRVQAGSAIRGVRRTAWGSQTVVLKSFCTAATVVNALARHYERVYVWPGFALDATLPAAGRGRVGSRLFDRTFVVETVVIQM